jgi:hypothetical protein
VMILRFSSREAEGGSRRSRPTPRSAPSCAGWRGVYPNSSSVPIRNSPWKAQQAGLLSNTMGGKRPARSTVRSIGRRQRLLPQFGVSRPG